ncbi:TOM1-like protein 1 isoform X2 [Bombina bombina]|uniref:TOM1-like protein 1 isoform X2 n=1 Tax=Bombina bombina TaxID=8345 RepID=UPI00235B0B11|nr:TOM1-like protein 1 isoform X2 [Bombina bombina]
MAFGKSSRDPFSTPVGHLIDINTSATVKSEDWGQFMNICDFINTTGSGSKDAVKAFKKRINKSYNHKELKYSLSLLEMCMQNCVPAFQSLVVKKEFCRDVLVKMLNPKYSLAVQMQNKILHLIRTWSTGLPENVDTSEIKELYLELVKKGIRFPSVEANGEPETEKAEFSIPTDHSPASISMESTAVHLSPEQIGKLYSEIDMVKMNVKVMSEILLETSPGTEKPDDMELLQDLQKACQEMQKRILKLLETVQNEEVIIELVQVNDDLNNVFLRYERFSRTRANRPSVLMRPAPVSEINDNQPSAPSLIEIDHRSPGVNKQINADDMTIPYSTFYESVTDTPCPLVTDTGTSVQPVPGQPKPFIYPQMDLLGLREAVNTPLSYVTQTQVPSVVPRSVYDNVSVPSATPLLPTVPALQPTLIPLQSNISKPTSDSNSDVSQKNSSLPVYYELLEFDPLAESNGVHTKDPIYEEIDSTLWKREAKNFTSC